MNISQINQNINLEKLQNTNSNSVPPQKLSQDSILKKSPQASTSVCATLFKFILGFFKWLFCCKNSTKTTIAVTPPNHFPSFTHLGNIFQGTLEALRAASYTTSNGKVVNLDLKTMKNNTRLYTANDISCNPPKKPPYTPTVISVVNSGAVQEGLKLKALGYKTAVINFANEMTPGGGVFNGARAQEEDNCYTTALYGSLAPSENKNIFKDTASYNIPEFGCIYSGDVPVIREPENKGFAWREKAETLNFISSAAYNQANRPKKGSNYIEGMRKKIQAQLQVALLQGCKAIVLGAFGCGAFGNNPNLVAELYKEELDSELYRHAFSQISFAVYVAKESDNANLEAFKTVFLEAK